MSRPESEAKLHYGEIPGFPVGYHWPDRKQLAKSKVHAALWAGIQGNMVHGARSIVLSGVFEDDEDLGDKLTTDLSSSTTVPTPAQVGDLNLTTSAVRKENRQKTRIGTQAQTVGSRQVSHVHRNPVRVIRGSKLNSRFAPEWGYDGLYKVVDCSKDRGKSGHNVCLFKLKRISGQPPIPTRRPDTSRANIVRRIAQPTLPSPSGSGSGSGSSSQSNNESEASDTSRTSRNSTNTGGYTGSDLKTPQRNIAGPNTPSNGLQHTSRTSSSTNGAGRYPDANRGLHSSSGQSVPSGSSRTAQVHKDYRQHEPEQVRVGVVKGEPSDRNSMAMDVS